MKRFIATLMISISSLGFASSCLLKDDSTMLPKMNAGQLLLNVPPVNVPPVNVPPFNAPPANTPPVNVPADVFNSDKDITAFHFLAADNPGVLSQDVTGTISGTSISLAVPYGTDVTALVPSITITGASVIPASGVAQDFTSPVDYTVTAGDRSTQVYTVTVAVPAWTWMSGANAAGASGVYGTKGVAAAGNVPGARQGSVTWTDASGNFWLFGGLGYDVSGSLGRMNDLWKRDGLNWTWVSGANTVNAFGVYGTKGIAATGNAPGARNDAVTWSDASGNFWLFGGYGRDGSGNWGYLNDLWKWDGLNWTWISGPSSVNTSGVYGTKGIAAAGNFPGGRFIAVSWTDSSGNFWLFGGKGYDGSGTIGLMNDLWKWDGTNWTWMSGAYTANAPGVYGTKGIAAASNVPGAREYAVSWTDSSGNLWLFGGFGVVAVANVGRMNDLWKWDGANWTWVSGSNGVGVPGVYGTKGIPDAGNSPGGRHNTVSWTDASGNFWLFGGSGYDSSGTYDFLNDLWKWDGSNWTWVSGENIVNAFGVYGSKGIAVTGNAPGARKNAVSWTDASGNLWLFGGEGLDGSGALGYLNDLWKFGPVE